MPFCPAKRKPTACCPATTLKRFCREIAARGPRIVAIKQGDHGATVFDREQNVIEHIPPYPARVDDLTGAGDSFCGGFAIGYVKTKDALQAALYGTVSASFIIEGFGGLHALSIKRATAESRLAELRHA